MKKIVITLSAMLLTLSAASCGNAKSDDTNEKKTLIAYFSCTKNTENAALRLQAATGGDIYEIQPVTPYTADDLDWKNRESRSIVEMMTEGFREPLGSDKIDVEPYDTIFVGFPIWCNRAPTIINSFLEAYDLTDKVIVPFATSGSSPIFNSSHQLQLTYPKLTILPGKRLNGATDEEIEDFVTNGGEEKEVPEPLE